MYCPSCGAEVYDDNFCGNCGVQLVYFNNAVFIKEEYDEIKSYHDSIDEFLRTNVKTEADISSQINDATIYEQLKADSDVKKEFIDALDDTESELLTFRNEIFDIKSDSVKLTYISSFDNIFGCLENKLTECLNIIERNLNYIDIYRNNIDNMDMSILNNDSNYENIKKYHEDIDELITNIIGLENDIQKTKESEESVNELKYNKATREYFINEITNSIDSISESKESIQKDLKDKEKMKILHLYDDKFGDIEVKMNKCVKLIEKAIKILEDYIEYLNKLVEISKDNPQIKLNKNRILDL